MRGRVPHYVPCGAPFLHYVCKCWRLFSARIFLPFWPALHAVARFEERFFPPVSLAFLSFLFSRRPQAPSSGVRRKDTGWN